MNKRPRSITVISWIFIVFGSIALLTGLLPSFNTTAAQRITELKGHWFVHVSRMLMVLGGVFMLYGFNWARLLIVVWIGFHIIISALHSPLQLLLHTLIFAVILYFLFRREATEYLRGKQTDAAHSKGSC
jgi:hypothetical protein